MADFNQKFDVLVIGGDSGMSGAALLAASETWAWVDEVYLTGATDADVARLGNCPLLESIRTLGFRRSALGPEPRCGPRLSPWTA